MGVVSEATIGPGTALEVIVAALDAGATFGDVLTLTDSDGNTQTVTIGERIVLPSEVETLPPV